MADETALAAIDTIVLAGGAGSRVRPLLGETPKVLADIAGRPFLDYLLAWLAGFGARRVALSIGVGAARVRAYMAGHDRAPPALVAVEEDRPLGTAGAVAFAARHCRSDPVLVVNGDTLVEADLGAFLRFQRARGGAALVAVAVADRGRYGGLDIGADDAVVAFREKSAAAGPGPISAGVYLFDRETLAAVAAAPGPSLECDVLARLPAGRLRAFMTTGRFIDIGTPETLAEAARLVPALVRLRGAAGRAAAP